MRIGHGFDVHQFGASRPLILAGVQIDYHTGLIAHSDGDVVLHALSDAFLGAIAARDIGYHFSDTDEQYKNIDSQIILKKVYEMVRQQGYQLLNLDITIIAQAPKLLNYIELMSISVANALEVERQQVNIKATTTEKLGFIGREQGIATEAVVLLKRSE